MFPGGAGERRATSGANHVATRDRRIHSSRSTWRSISAISASVKSASLGESASWIPGNSSTSRNVSSQWAASSVPVAARASDGRGLAVASALVLMRRRSLRSSISSQILVGRDRLGPAAGGRLANAAIGRDDRQRLGIGVRGDELLDPGVGILIAQGKKNAQPAIFGIECEIARVHRGIEDHRRLPGASAAPAPPRAHRETAAARGETPRGPASARAGPPACITLYPSMSQRMCDPFTRSTCWPVSPLSV